MSTEPHLVAYRFRLPMRPVGLAGREYAAREGLVIRDLRAENRWAEASPLPGFSREGLEAVMTEFRTGDMTSSASLRFAADTLCDLAEPVPPVPINALVTGTPRDVMAMVSRLASSPFPSVKIKVGPQLGSPTESAALVRRVRESLAAGQGLRLDANRAWTLDQAIEFGQGVRGVPIDYIEEPIDDPGQLEDFWQETRVPYALDETLCEATPAAEIKMRFPHAEALVVKPTLLGGRTEIANFANLGIRLVFSGAFESGIGTAAVARLAHEFAPGVPAGLEAHVRLLGDLLDSRIQFMDGRIVAPGQPQIRWDLLQGVT